MSTTYLPTTTGKSTTPSSSPKSSLTPITIKETASSILDNAPTAGTDNVEASSSDNIGSGGGGNHNHHHHVDGGIPSPLNSSSTCTSSSSRGGHNNNNNKGTDSEHSCKSPALSLSPAPSPLLHTTPSPPPPSSGEVGRSRTEGAQRTVLSSRNPSFSFASTSNPAAAAATTPHNNAVSDGPTATSISKRSSTAVGSPVNSVVAGTLRARAAQRAQLRVDLSHCTNCVKSPGTARSTGSTTTSPASATRSGEGQTPVTNSLAGRRLPQTRNINNANGISAVAGSSMTSNASSRNTTVAAASRNGGSAAAAAAEGIAGKNKGGARRGLSIALPNAPIFTLATPHSSPQQQQHATHSQTARRSLNVHTSQQQFHARQTCEDASANSSLTRRHHHHYSNEMRSSGGQLRVGSAMAAAFSSSSFSSSSSSLNRQDARGMNSAVSTQPQSSLSPYNVSTISDSSSNASSSFIGNSREKVVLGREYGKKKRRHDGFSAVEVIPGLFLGAYSDAVDPEVLRQHNISLVVNMTSECPVTTEMRDNPHGIRYLQFPLKDHSDEVLSPFFPVITQVIHEQLHRRDIYLGARQRHIQLQRQQQQQQQFELRSDTDDVCDEEDKDDVLLDEEEEEEGMVDQSEEGNSHITFVNEITIECSQDVATGNGDAVTTKKIPRASTHNEEEEAVQVQLHMLAPRQRNHYQQHQHAHPHRLLDDSSNDTKSLLSGEGGASLSPTPASTRYLAGTRVSGARGGDEYHYRHTEPKARKIVTNGAIASQNACGGESESTPELIESSGVCTHDDTSDGTKKKGGIRAAKERITTTRASVATPTAAIARRRPTRAEASCDERQPPIPNISCGRSASVSSFSMLHDGSDGDGVVTFMARHDSIVNEAKCGSLPAAGLQQNGESEETLGDATEQNEEEEAAAAEEEEGEGDDGDDVAQSLQSLSPVTYFDITTTAVTAAAAIVEGLALPCTTMATSTSTLHACTSARGGDSVSCKSEDSPQCEVLCSGAEKEHRKQAEESESVAGVVVTRVHERDCGGTLVHCRMGISRSASVVLAYLILYGNTLAPMLGTEEEEEEEVEKAAVAASYSSSGLAGSTNVDMTSSSTIVVNAAAAAAGAAMSPSFHSCSPNANVSSEDESTSASHSTSDGTPRVLATGQCVDVPYLFDNFKQRDERRVSTAIARYLHLFLASQHQLQQKQKQPTPTSGKTGPPTFSSAKLPFSACIPSTPPPFTSPTIAAGGSLNSPPLPQLSSPETTPSEVHCKRTHDQVSLACPPCARLRIALAHRKLIHSPFFRAQQQQLQLQRQGISGTPPLPFIVPPPDFYGNRSLSASPCTAVTLPPPTIPATGEGFATSQTTPLGDDVLYTPMANVAAFSPFTAGNASQIFSPRQQQQQQRSGRPALATLRPPTPSVIALSIPMLSSTTAGATAAAATGAFGGNSSHSSQQQLQSSSIFWQQQRLQSLSQSRESLSQLPAVRSPTTPCLSMSYREALELLKSRKPDVNPNIGFTVALRELAGGGDIYSLSTSF